VSGIPRQSERSARPVGRPEILPWVILLLLGVEALAGSGYLTYDCFSDEHCEAPQVCNVNGVTAQICSPLFVLAPLFFGGLTATVLGSVKIVRVTTPAGLRLA
jgi:hypothetical protein